MKDRDQPEFEAVVLGCSAGGTRALCTLLPELPADFQLPLIVVQHLLDSAGDEHLAVFSATCRLPVAEPQDKEPLRGGVVYVAPPGYHVLIEAGRTFALSNDEPVHCSRPAIDVLFETAAEVWRERLCGVLLTGANRDGGEGLFRIHQRGGTCVVEDPLSAECPVMPQHALDRFKPDQVLPLEQIGPYIARLNTTTTETGS